MSLLACVALCIFLTSLWWSTHVLSRKTCWKPPPGPRSLPIIGNLHILSTLPHRTLRELSKTYGPIMSIHLGKVPTVVITSAQAAELFLKTYDNVFASRPKLQASEYFTYSRKGMALTQYGPYWRNVRKFCTLELLSSKKIEALAGMRREELAVLVEEVKEAAMARKVVDVSEKVAELIENMTCRMIFGRCKYDKFKLKSNIDEMFVLGGAFNLADYVPLLRPFDLQNATVAGAKSSNTNIASSSSTISSINEDLRRNVIPIELSAIPKLERTYPFVQNGSNRFGFELFVEEIDGGAVSPEHFSGKQTLVTGLTQRMKKTSKALDKILETIIDEHEKNANNGAPSDMDFIDIMLSLRNKTTKSHDELSSTINRTNIKAIVLDMIVGAIDTSYIAIEWVLSELIRHPRVMKRLQEELETTVGVSKMVEESDLPKLEYLGMVVKESLRLHPVGPLLIPHESMEDIVINGYFIPKKAWIFVNCWAIGRDPKEWSENAEEFLPERFVGSNVDLRGRDFKLIPFGSGRRGCPGINLGLINIQLVVAQLVHCFDWELPNAMSPSDLDMSEVFSLTVPRAKHLLAVATYRF